ncbi:MAG: hypothetical protein IT432_05670, partial [Phycisphaerales bacterium]|nr:hypothetical protein [Phycisphaerales bacterium]
MSMHALNRRLFVAMAALALPLGGGALAQPVLITGPATVGATDTQIKDQQSGQFVNLSTAQITVQGTTLTVNGRHAIASLNIISSGVVTHGNSFTHDYSGGAGTDVVHGMYLIVTGDVVIEAGGSIEVSGRGYWHGVGPGDGNGYYAGGGYGGSGGEYSSGYGVPYGSASQPTDLGSSGHVGVGGGAVRLVVSGALTVDGSVLANGENGGGNGSGSGGSIWISAGTLSGVGSIRANGGSSTNYGGGGGGGRIAIDAAGTTFSGAMQAYSGQNSTTGGLYNGGAGTIYLYGTPAVLIYDNGGQAGPSL